MASHSEFFMSTVVFASSATAIADSWLASATSAASARARDLLGPTYPRLSDADVQQILALSLAPGASWKLVSDQSGDRVWVRSDGKVVALLNAQKFLQVQEKGFHQPTQ